MGVAVVSGDGHIVPLVVIQRPFAFALDEVGPISKVKNIVDVSAKERLLGFNRTEISSLPLKLFFQMFTYWQPEIKGK